jgi:hypothetical protein
MRTLSLTLLAALIASGCASTSITGYTDPAYEGKKYGSTIVLAEGVGLEKAARLESGICAKFTDAGIKCHPFQSLFPPTRNHEPDAVFQELRHQGFESMVVILPAGNFSASQSLGSYKFGSASVMGGQIQGQSSSVALTSFSRQSYVRLILVDAQTRDTAWLGDARTEGSGMVNVTESAFSSSLTDGAAKALMNSPHF